MQLSTCARGGLGVPGARRGGSGSREGEPDLFHAALPVELDTEPGGYRPVVDAAARIDRALVARPLSPISDVRGGADYRIKAAAELIRRAISDLTEGTA